MRIFLVTPIYANTTHGSGATPVVHYFAKEWVKMGNEVHVYHIRARFPRWFYSISRRFQHKLNTYFGSLVPTEYPNDLDFESDGVMIHRLAIKKYIPHSRYSRRTIDGIVDTIESGLSLYGAPDVIIGHWHNPSLDILIALKERLNIRTCLVLHENSFSMEKYYGRKTMDYLKQIDVIGFRNRVAQKNYIEKYGRPKSSFIAYSGVSSSFIDVGREYQPLFENGVNRFVYVGSLIARKYPEKIIRSLDAAYKGEPYFITYVGDGEEERAILCEKNDNSKGTISFTGRIAREEIIDYLKEAQCFVMISRGEVFGLVYLEAMALGLIPIGSRNEGIDGIIVDGQNGFLCEAGNAEELTDIIQRLKHKSWAELNRLSQNAKKTAQDFSDSNVANHYLQSIIERNE